MNHEQENITLKNWPGQAGIRLGITIMAITLLSGNFQHPCQNKKIDRNPQNSYGSIGSLFVIFGCTNQVHLLNFIARDIINQHITSGGGNKV
jgi:hypothetical protein